MASFVVFIKSLHFQPEIEKMNKLARENAFQKGPNEQKLWVKKK